MMRSFLRGLALVLVLALAPAAQSDVPESGAENFEALDRLMPPRERDFIAIINVILIICRIIGLFQYFLIGTR